MSSDASSTAISAAHPAVISDSPALPVSAHTDQMHTQCSQKQPTQQPPTSSSVVYCLICQGKLELHRSLFASPSSDESECASSSAKSATHYYEEYVDQCEDMITGIEHRLELNAPVTSCRTSGNLLELIAESSNPLDVPMCKQKCANAVSGELSNQLAALERECINYKQSLDELLKRRAECPFDQDAGRRKLEELKDEERELLEQLAFLEEEENALNRELDSKLAERKKVSDRDEELYRRLRDNHRTLIDQADEQRSLKQQIKQTNEQIQRLTKMNVLDMVFHIWVDGEYGTISGFRLGRLRHEHVEWNEINAALGQMAFLLKVISERLGMEFVSYAVFPCGNMSFIRMTHKTGVPAGRISEELPLYGGGGWRPFGQPALDKGLVAFMECFCQIEQRLRQFFPPNTQLLPYRMLKDKIVDKDSQYLVKMQFNSEERWTKAMKCLLLNLKRVIGILITLPSLAAEQHSQRSSRQEAVRNGSGSAHNSPGPGSSCSTSSGSAALPPQKPSPPAVKKNTEQ